jgi:hypothetical protein
VADLLVEITVIARSIRRVSTVPVDEGRLATTLVGDVVAQTLAEVGVLVRPESCTITWKTMTLQPATPLAQVFDLQRESSPDAGRSLALTVICPGGEAEIAPGSVLELTRTETTVVLAALPPPAPVASPPADAPVAAKPPPPPAAPAPAAAKSEEDSEFELTLDEEGGLAPLEEEAPAAEGDKDIFEETDFDVPALEEESTSEGVSLEDRDKREVASAALEEEEADEDEDEDSGEEDLDDEDFDDEDEEEAEEERAAPRRATIRKRRMPAPRARAKAKVSVRKKEEAAAPVIQRHATVRYYSRMNPNRIYPLMVALTKKALQQIAQKDVGQVGKKVKMKVGAALEIEPVLPGCECYPPRQKVRVDQGDIKAEFHVVPRMIGQVPAAKVVIYENGEKLTELPLNVRVSNPLFVTMAAGATLLVPFVSATMKHYHVDFESQLQNGFDAYLVAARAALILLRPEVLAGILLALTGLLYLILRPRQRDAFWDITPEGARPTPAKG